MTGLADTLMQLVNELDWDLTALADEQRRFRLLNPLSPEDLISLIPAIKRAYSNAPLPVNFTQVEGSVRGEFSKIWIFEDGDAFNGAQDYTLNPPRWVKNQATLARRAPLPAHLTVDLKGTFVNLETGEPWVHELKLDRANDLHTRGFAQ